MRQPGVRQTVGWWSMAAALALAATGCTTVNEQPATGDEDPFDAAGGVSFQTEDAPGGTGGLDQPEVAPDQPEVLEPEVVEPDVSEPPEDVGPPADVPPTGDCDEGAACDDGDLCTYNDHCTGGTCAGTPFDCSDDLPCTTDACVDGICQAPIAEGFCLIDGICWNDGQSSPANACQTCDALQATKSWTPNDGFPCDDGDSCTWPDVCLDGACSSTPAVCPDDGDPCTEASCIAGSCEVEVIEGCGPFGAPCTYHADCYPEGVCGVWETTGAEICSVPCAGDSDCTSGHRCSKVPGSAQVGFCEPSPDAAPAGATCTEETDCASGLCEGHSCSNVCLDEAHCASTVQTCHAIGEPATGWVTAACSDDPPEKKPIGQACALDGSECSSGHCDVMAATSGSKVCSSLCTTKSDCLPAQECNIVYYGDVPNPDSVYYHPQFQYATYDAVTACYTPPSGLGSQADGTVCTQNYHCPSHKCLPLVPGSDTRYCTRFCVEDADCKSGMICKLEALNLASAWLQEGAAIGAKPVNVNGWTLIRVCKF